MKLGGLAFYGGSFNPPTSAHKAILSHLLGQDFSKIILKPCGQRKDKEALSNQLDLRVHRIKDELSHEDTRYSLDLSGVNIPMLPTILELEQLKRSFPDMPIWLVCGTDLFEDEGNGRCQIQRWFKGEELFKEASFLIYPRPGKNELLFPPHYHLVKDFEPIDISSTQMRLSEEASSNSSGTSHS